MTDFDLNLVRTFVVLFETRSVTAAAARLNLTQPTVSYGLRKLRRQFGDQLFLRSGNGLVATTTAGELYGPLRAALSGIEQAVTGLDRFDPATADTEFTICLSDLGETSLLPRLLARLREHAPGVHLTVRPLDIHNAEQQLVRGEIDAFIASPLVSSPWIARIPLFLEDYVGLVDRDHPRLTSSHPDVAALERERFVGVFGPTGQDSPLRELQARGLDERIVLQVTRFSSLPYLLRGGELVAVAPRDAASTYARTHPLRLLELPFAVEPIQVSVYARHPHARGAAQQWLIDELHTVLAAHD